MRDFVEKSDNLNLEGGPDFPVKCTQYVDDGELITIFGKTQDECDIATQKIAEINKPTSIIDGYSNPTLVYTAIGLAAAAVVCVIVGVVMNILDKKKKKAEQ